MLRDRGHVVDQFKASTADSEKWTTLRQMLAVPSFLWSRRTYKSLQQRILEFQPHVVHVHNTFPKLSPSVFWASRRAGVPAVQTLHNFRYVCANALLLRDGRRCEQCVGHAPGQPCNIAATPIALREPRWLPPSMCCTAKLGTYASAVDVYVLLNDFNREIFVRGGFPSYKLVANPNFVPVSSLGHSVRKPQVVFAGEFTRSKGLPLLLEAWSIAGLDNFSLLLIGDGPERKSMEQQYAGVARVTWCGRLPRSSVLEQIAASRFLVFPSLAYENCPMVVLEALSVGTPVVAADHPSLQTMIGHQREGLLFQAGDAPALASALRDALATDHETWSRWSSAARHTQAERFSEDANYSQLMAIYRSVILRRTALAPDVEVAMQPSR